MSAWWPFGRRKRDTPAPSDDPRPEHATPSAVAPSPPVDAWRDLPPLRPSAPSIELTAPVQRLAETMTSTQHTGVTQDELGHARAADGPAGIVAGLLKPRGAAHRERVGGGALVYAAPTPEPVAGVLAVPLRRGRAATTPDAGPEPVAAPVGVDTPEHPPAPRADGRRSAVEPSPSSSTSSGVTVAGAQRMPAVSSDLPTVAARPLHARQRAPQVAAPSDSMPVAVAGPSSAPPPAQVATASSTMASNPSPAPPPPQVATATSSSPAVSGSSLGSDSPASIPSAPLVGRTRIVRRIGEPLRERPASMVPTADAPAAARQPLLAGHGGIAGLPQAAVERPRPSLPEPGIVPDRTARPVASVDVASGVRPASDSVDAGGATGRADTRPLVGSRPSIQRLASAPTGATVLTGTPSGPPAGEGPAREHEPVPVRWGAIAQRGVQRTPEGVPADLRAELEPVLGTPLADVKVHRDAETGEAARQLSAKAFTAGGEVFLPDWHGSTSGGEARTILTHELTHVAQQRRLGSALPDEASSAGTELESEARAVARHGPAVPARPVAPSRSPSAPQRLAGEAPPPPVRVLASRPAGGMLPSDVAAQVQAAAAAAGIAAVAGGADHRYDAGHGSTPATDSTYSTVFPAAAAPGGAGPPSAVQRLPDQGGTDPVTTGSVTIPETPSDDPAQLDELARRLYPRFRTRLRQDLLADRERSGRLFDVR